MAEDGELMFREFIKTENIVGFEQAIRNDAPEEAATTGDHATDS